MYTRKGIKTNKSIILYPKRYKQINICIFIPEKVYFMKLSEFVKEKRNQVNLTQTELAEKAGVGLRFVRELEQGKETVRLDKVNQVLQLFGYQVGAIPIKLG
jgi:y4mF family transcriptional regulator